ncbi:MAG: STAS domain-containing protein [Ignavibacteriae bacterium]|nr:STAS domain-containing protein [Ignavibacteria bacterium]MBI3363832.1 STAS domain-containing protein [Ignavibacteriota bacterium]
MHLEEKIMGEVAVVYLKGELLDDEDDLTLRQKVTSLTVDEIKKVIIDLGKVSRINSRGLSALISAVKTMRAYGGDIRFTQIDKQINDIFVEMRLVQVFNTYETVGRAMASYQL